MEVAIEDENRSEQVCFTFRVLLLFSFLFIRNRKTQEDSGGTGGPGRTQVDWPGRSGRYWLGLGSGSSSGGAGAGQEPELSPEPGSLTCFSSFSFVSSGPSSTLRHPGNSRETCKVTLSIYCSEGQGGPTGPPHGHQRNVTTGTQQPELWTLITWSERRHHGSYLFHDVPRVTKWKDSPTEQELLRSGTCRLPGMLECPRDHLSVRCLQSPSGWEKDQLKMTQIDPSCCNSNPHPPEIYKIRAMIGSGYHDVINRQSVGGYLAPSVVRRVSSLYLIRSVVTGSLFDEMKPWSLTLMVPGTFNQFIDDKNKWLAVVWTKIREHLTEVPLMF